MNDTVYTRRLVSIDPARRRSREYRIEVLPSDAGGWVLHTWRGRYGQRLRHREQRFDDMNTLELHIQELLHRRVQHGYVPAPDEAQQVRLLPL